MEAKETGRLSMPGREDGAAGWTGLRQFPEEQQNYSQATSSDEGEIMKKQTLAAAALLSLLFAASQAEALYIADTYWGAGEASTPNDGKERPQERAATFMILILKATTFPEWTSPFPAAARDGQNLFGLG